MEDEVKNPEKETEVTPAATTPDTLTDFLTSKGWSREQLDAYDPQWQEKVTEAQTNADSRVEAVRMDYAINSALSAAGVRNAKAVKALLDMEGVKMDGESLSGMSEQLSALRESDPYLFNDNGGKPFFSNTSKGQKTSGADEEIVNKKYANNPFFRK